MAKWIRCNRRRYILEAEVLRYVIAIGVWLADDGGWLIEGVVDLDFATLDAAKRHAEALLRDELLRLAGELCKEESK